MRVVQIILILFMDSVGVKTVDIADLQRGMEADAIWQFETLDEMIAKFNINKEPFLDELKKYNEYVKSGKDADFGRVFQKYKGATTQAIEKPPFFAARPGPKIHHCMGYENNTSVFSIPQRGLHCTRSLRVVK